MGKLTAGTAPPDDFITRPQLIATLESLTPVHGEFCDGTTIIVTGGKVLIGVIGQAAVSGLVAALAAKADDTDLLAQLAALTTQAGVVQRTTAGDLDLRAKGLAVADVNDAALPANGAIGALTSSGTTTQAEFNALRDAAEGVRDAVAECVISIELIRNRLKTTGGAAIIAD